MKIIVGSQALKHFGILNLTEAKDLDIWYSGNVYLPKSDSHEMPEAILEKINTRDGFATPDMILTIKMSHLSWDIKWDKTKRHILLLKSLGYKPDLELYHELKRYWQTVHGDKSFLSLKKSKDKFFDDFVEYKYDHDYLHELVAYPNKPVYTKCLKENEQVLIDKNKFMLLSFDEQIKMFMEEITVIAIERWMVNIEISWIEAFLLALKKTIISLTKNWANDFIIENLEYFIPDYKYFKHALEVLNLSKSDDVVRLLLKEALNLTDKDLNKVDWESFYTGLAMDWELEFVGSLNVNGNLYEITDVFPDYELILQNGGYDCSEKCESVFKLKGKLLKVNYSYRSHYGFDFDDIDTTVKEVKPVVKTITVYESLT